MYASYLQELMEKLKVLSDAQLMQIAIDDLSNSSLSLEDRRRALQELLVLVESIDNANGRCTCSMFYMFCLYVSVQHQILYHQGLECLVQ